jgi:stage IV sporulation protein FB
MKERLNWMLPSFFVGRMFSTDVRISWWFGIVPLVVCPNHGLALGLTFTVALYLSALLHEFAHVFAARWTGGTADEVHLTPIGGIALVRPALGAFGMGITAAAGPAVNLLICLLTFPGWNAPETLPGAFNPFVLPIDRLHTDTPEVWRDLGSLLFVANWIGLLVNLLPVLPLDGGHVLRASLMTRINPEFVNRTALNVGMFVAIVILIFGAYLDLSQVVLIGTFVLMMNVIQLFQAEINEQSDISAYDSDLSSVEESLFESSPLELDAPQNPLDQWRERRRARREQQDLIRRTEVEQQLDELLAKVHEYGFQSLSEQEKKSLQSCSKLIRERGKSES